MRKGFMVFLFLIMIVMLCSLALGQEGMGKGRVAGTVVDDKGKAVASVKITARHQTFTKAFTAVTDEKGKWAILGMAGGLWRVTAEKEGYMPGYVDMNISQLSKNPPIEIRITPIPKGGIITDEKSKQILGKGQQLFDQGKYDEALAEFQSFSEKNPSVYQVYFNLGECYFKKGDYDMAIEQYHRFLEKEPDDPGVLSRTGEAFVKKEDLEKALPYFEKIIETHPDDSASYYNIAEIYFNAGKAENAIQFYQKAHSLEPDWDKPIIKLAYAHMNLNQLDKAVEYFEKYLQISPEGDDAPIAKELLKQLKPTP